MLGWFNFLSTLIYEKRSSSSFLDLSELSYTILMATTSSKKIRGEITGDFVVGFVHFREIALAEEVWELKDVILYFFAGGSFGGREVVALAVHVSFV